MRPLDQLLQQEGKPRLQKLETRLLLVALAFLAWAYFAQVDRVVTAPGKVIPSDKVKVIQHLEGGIIEKLYVREAQRVKAGEPLLELDLASGGVNIAEMKARLGSLELAKQRLLAEVNLAETLELSEVDGTLRESANAEFYTFKSRRDELRETIGSLRGQQTQAQKGVSELSARLRSQESALSLAREQLKITQSLLEDKLVSQIEHNERRTKVAQLTGDIASTKEAIDGAKASVEQAKSREREETARFRRRASDELGDVERRLTSLMQELAKADEQQTRSTIYSPIDGFIKNVKYQSIGNVVKSGEAIMEIVPENERLVVEAKLAPSDRGFVIPQQESLVKISAYDFYRYGGLEGRVESIAADTNVEQDNSQYYRVIIVTDRSYVGDDPAAKAISPGMLGEVSIKVDTQSVLWALIRPILRIKQEALQET
ncbi:MAG: HlyD family type I secretion periplasmic adaptor subunit [Gammaproteobacteria bacterium]|nr:HlyD family type I secretion periplasmic adaptor subunit [Gammaproteobacteria bacterium]